MNPYLLKQIIPIKRTIPIILFFMIMATAPGFSAQTAETVKKRVDTSINTRQKTQKQLDQWEQERAKLIMTYEAEQQKQEMLLAANRELVKEEKSRNALLTDLKEQQSAHLKIQEEMLPFLNEVQARLEKMVISDPPFLAEERKNRLHRLAVIMEDVEISIAEKYRKVMEALFVEAEYGNTIEVTQDKITLSGNQVLADVFRLGRISLFALTLDHKSAGIFNVAENQWSPLDEAYIQSVAAAVEMGRKRRTVEIISLPVGQLAR